MPKRKILYISIGAATILAILIGIGPIIVASVMRQVAARQGIRRTPSQIPANEHADKPGSQDLLKPGMPGLMLMVTGKVSVIKDDNNASWIILTTDAGLRYILIEQQKELKDLAGKEITVVGTPHKPVPESIGGRPIRFSIEIKTLKPKE